MVRRVSDARRFRQRSNRRPANWNMGLRFSRLRGQMPRDWRRGSRTSAAPFEFRQTQLLETLSVTANVGKNYTFSLSQCPNGSSFAGLFGEWRIKSVKLDFMPHINVAALNVGATATEAPSYGFAIDYVEQATVPSSMDVLRQYQSFSYHKAFSPASVTITPKYSLLASVAGSAVGLCTTQNSFVSTTNPDVPWRGVRAYFESSGAGDDNYIVDVTATVVYQFRTVV